jgi:PEP-CTERM motif
MKNPVLKLLISLAALAASSGVASASVITIGFTASQILASNGTSFTLNLPKFDPGTNGIPNGATLNSVTLYFFASDQVSQFQLTNSGADGSFTIADAVSVVKTFSNTAYTFDRFLNENLTTFDTLNPDTGTGFSTGAGSCTPGDNFIEPYNNCSQITLAAGQTVDYASTNSAINPNYNNPNFPGGNSAIGPFTVTNIDPVYGFTSATGVQGVTGLTLTDTAHMSGYNGSGNFALSGTAQNTFSELAGTLDLSNAVTQTLSYSAEVDYTYTYTPAAAPEPATMALLGSALFGLVAFRKRLARGIR